MKKVKWFFGILFMFMSIISCQKDDTNHDGLSPSDLKSTAIVPFIKGVNDVCGATTTFPLFADKTISAGTVTLGNDEINLYVTYKTTLGVFGTLHLFVNEDFTLLPRAGGKITGVPVPGLFPYSVNAKGLTEFTFTIPLADITTNLAFNENAIYIVAHAELLVDENNDGEFEIKSAFAGTLTDENVKRWYFYDKFIININDFTVPADEVLTVPCGTVLEPPTLPVVTNACGTVLTPSEPVITNNLVEGSGTVIYTYTYTDVAKHSHVWTYTYTVEPCTKDAYAKGEYVFTDAANTAFNPEGLPGLNITDSQWGWAINQGSTWINPTANYNLVKYRYCGGWSSCLDVIQNAIQITNDGTNLYVTINYNLYDVVVYVSITPSTPNGGYTSFSGGSNWATSITASIPLNSIPNYTPFETPIYVFVFAKYGTDLNNYRAYSFSPSLGYGGFVLYNPTPPVLTKVEYPIYMDAQGNNTANGTLVGKVLVSYDGTAAQLFYYLNEGYLFNKVDAYVWDTPPETIPNPTHTYVRQYDEWINKSWPDIITVQAPDFDGDGKVWMILHTKVKTLN